MILILKFTLSLRDYEKKKLEFPSIGSQQE